MDMLKIENRIQQGVCEDFVLTSLCLELPLSFLVLLRLDHFHMLQYLQGPRKQPESSAEGSLHSQFKSEQLERS